ncbi:MAG: DHHA1 domain-containing protein, partial [Candidatus Sulfotelmatobacter sp.]
TFSDHDLNFVKLLAQKLTRQSGPVIALLSTTSPQPALVFAQTPGQPFNMGSLLKEAVGTLGGRGGGSKDLAQGGVPDSEALAAALKAATEKIENKS